MSTAPTPISVREVARICNGTLVDDAARGSLLVSRVAPLHAATPDAVTWVSDEHYSKILAACPAVAVIGPKNLVGHDPRGIVVADSEVAISQVLGRFAIPLTPPPPGVHPTAVVSASAKLGSGVSIGPCSVVGPDATLGDGTVVYDGVSIGAGVRIGRQCTLLARCVVHDRCEMGDRVIVKAGAVIGSDGFGFFFRDGEHRKIPHSGTVVIESDCEIGANSCVDRAKFGHTRIGRGTKIDNLVQVAHNVEIGQLCILVAQCGLAGSSRLGNGVMLAGHTGVVQGVSVGDRTRVGAKGVVHSDVGPDQTLAGDPATHHIAHFRDVARTRKLGELYKQVAELSRRVKALEASADDRKAD
jgi:UDP-3-O-[3-hydroxymyristoyl] glucosamine N-acyltransferase